MQTAIKRRLQKPGQKRGDALADWLNQSKVAGGAYERYALRLETVIEGAQESRFDADELITCWRRLELLGEICSLHSAQLTTTDAQASITFDPFDWGFSVGLGSLNEDPEWIAATNSLLSAAVLNGAGLIDRLRRCRVCSRWFYAEHGARLSCSPSCRDKAWRHSPDGRKKRAAYMRGYRQRLTEYNKARELRGKSVAATRKILRTLG